MGGRLIGPGCHEFVQAKIQQRHAKTPEGKLMSTKQKAEASNAKHPPTGFIYQSNIRNLGAARHINN